MRAPAGSAEHRRRVPLATICTPTIARISVVLPQPLGPSSPVTEPRAHAQRDLVEHLPAAPHDPQAIDTQGGLHVT